MVNKNMDNSFDWSSFWRIIHHGNSGQKFIPIMENSVDYVTAHSNSPDREFETKGSSINQILCNRIHDKKAFMRIVEATLAVLIIFSALLLLSYNRTPQKTTDLGKMIPPLLREVAENPDLRTQIINYNTSKPQEDQSNAPILNNTELFIKERIPNQALNFSISICPLNDSVCPLRIPYPREAEEIFAGERVISASVTERKFDPKRIKLFIWRKS
ncbi:hypothetical protein HYV50_05675 [Candidatus Pacearchaeota archaeon]|nr:hypothetical protein [Candidatus Pacearchaeota archaeon]